MDRRSLIALGATGLVAALVGPLRAAAAQAATVTRWKVTSEEGADAIAFLGPLSGGSLYTEFYEPEIAAFAPLLPAPIKEDIAKLWAEAGEAGFGLLGPVLPGLLSTGGNAASIPTILAALNDSDRLVLPSYRSSRLWAASDWTWFKSATPRLIAIFSALEAAGFAAFRAARAGGLEGRIALLQSELERYDVISLQSKLTGKTFDPIIEIVILLFAKPHGISLQGQKFIQAADASVAATVRNAAHEMLHPPVDMNGAAAQAALAVLGRDPLMARIVREHDKKFGYNSLEGILNEDLVSALDQLIAEQLGVARNPADRWKNVDDGMHVLSAGFYGMLRQDRWVEHGGSIEQWLYSAATSGRLDPANFHLVASEVLARPIDHLWPLS